MTEQLRKMVDSAWMLILARLMAVFGVPIAVSVMGYSATQFFSMKEDIVEMRAALVVGIEPRVTRLEDDAKTLRQEIRDRTMNRFSRTDAEAMEARIQRELERMEKSIRELRRQ